MPRDARSSTAREDGFVLFAVVLITLLLGGLSAGFLGESAAEKVSVDLRKHRLFALQICEKGITEATMEILAQVDQAGDGMGFASGSFGGGEYEVTSTQSADNPDRWTLLARGTYQGATRRVQVGVRRRAGGDYVEGLFAKDALTFEGITATDAYDSRLGTYASQAVNGDAGGTYALGGGHVGSNKDIVLNGSTVSIRGNAIPGPMHSVNVSGDPIIWGDVLPRRRALDLPPVPKSEFEAALLNNNNGEFSLGPGGGAGGVGGGPGGNPTLNGRYNPQTFELTGAGDDEIHLTGGTYFFTNVRLTGLSQLIVDGPTTIYVTGDFDVSGGGFINASGIPSDLKIYAHPYHLAGKNPTSSQVKIRGGSKAAMATYSPGAQLTIMGGDDVFGSFIGESIAFAGEARFHYDKALGDTDYHSRPTIERLFWRDLEDQFRR